MSTFIHLCKRPALDDSSFADQTRKHKPANWSNFKDTLLLAEA